ncbi:hypothetical protein HU200_014903 [Digitaria exilis]|uniref:DUF6598 domain-containing protein n=1 Tax=Digitaria exilis TaxID=1010633 RepID=A0A835FC33_9POAL|nr:hypothetical protein HU200_014903 [Digitaria exilis]
MCEYNIAFFDLDEESKIVHGPLFRDIPPSRYYFLDESINVISIKVAESDVRYPVRIYGTVLARDLNDYRCVYLFRRGRDDPQLITRKVCIYVLEVLRTEVIIDHVRLISTPNRHKGPLDP